MRPDGKAPRQRQLYPCLAAARVAAALRDTPVMLVNGPVVARDSDDGRRTYFDRIEDLEDAYGRDSDEVRWVRQILTGHSK